MKKDYSKYNDEILLEIVRSDSKESELAFAEIYNRYATNVNAYCKFMLRDIEKVQDIFQEVFIRFFKKIKSDFENINIKAYLIKVARNLCLNYFKRNKEFISIENFDLGFTESNYEQKELINVITRTIDLLDEKYKEPFIMREIEGLSYNEIAEICELSVTNAKTRVKRAREKLLELLNPFLKDYVE